MTHTWARHLKREKRERKWNFSNMTSQIWLEITQARFILLPLRQMLRHGIELYLCKALSHTYSAWWRSNVSFPRFQLINVFPVNPHHSAQVGIIKSNHCPNEWWMVGTYLFFLVPSKGRLEYLVWIRVNCRGIKELEKFSDWLNCRIIFFEWMPVVT